uniref:Pentatricopeptide repeat-containing protein At4g18750, chloroplastic n=1 Tax=Anthurium amnicola TaxID=1678845 RepID=A0A1D1XZQ3_9ARAE
MISPAALFDLYGRQGSWRQLLSLYRHLLHEGSLRPNTFTFPTLLRSCPDLCLGEALHADAAKRGLGSGADPFVSGAVVDMYCRCGGPSAAALQAFDEMPEPEPVMWNAAISSFFRAGRCDGARSLFDRMPCPNDVTWSAMVAGYTQNGRAGDALLIFKRMVDELGSARGSVPNSHTVAAILSACAHLCDCCFAMQVHGYAVRISSYVEENDFVGSVLLDVYGKCGRLTLARQVFDSMAQKNVVAWSSLIANFVRHGDPSAAIRVFKDMVCSGASPNVVTLTTALSASGHIPSLASGKELHAYVLRRRLDRPDAFVPCALIDMYGKCGSMVCARSAFEEYGGFLGLRVTPMWNSVISGYVANNCPDEGWGMIRSMCLSSSGAAKPNSITLAIILPLCATSTSLRIGKEVHCYALKMGLDRELLVGNSLLDMYSKCGKIICARNQFDLMPEKNRISWTTLIDAYGMHGNAEDAISIFQRMVGEQNVDPDPITFVALISACSHSGLVEEGLRFFNKMAKEYGITPTEEVYGCLVDLLARAGCIDEARKFMASMPIKPSPSAWGALLGACRIHGIVDQAEFTVQHLLELEPKGTGFPTLLSNIYAERGMLDQVAKLRKAMAEMGVVKRRGYSLLDTEGASREL